MFKKTIFIAGLLFIYSTAASGEESENVVKKSRNGYCHYQTSDFYTRTMHFEKFETLAACIASGGKFPPTNKVNNATPEVKMSNSMICHDKNSAFYEQTKNFVAFENLENCRANGGK
ncbi:hypothetical protein SAMN06297280_3416 [Arsukibacterium tuosuense]|uniref:YARHG domain-containing protein n=1 Tax=Arsukibacterium tuosuense TaxID=1323745 RepID=A0A285JDX1_9GAMM|nr:hypothetical protein [Arsukibacterium tuosuense]SNY58480.1 hypothetical protein SAMN06297280_3416 [Arsukibacterium tuosuense]